MNVACLIACALVLRFATLNETLGSAIAFLAFLQGTAVVLNLLPVPGLDGFGILESFFPPNERAMIAPFGAIVFMIFFVIMVTAPALFQPIFNAAETACNWAGISSIDMGTGMDNFRFWNSGPS
jgi:Zn-dependent protease